MSRTLGKLHLSTVQAKLLQVKAGTRWSPYFEKCALLVSANASYQDAEIDASRIIDYEAWQTAGHPIGSGHVESLVKQIALRVKLPGAQWRVDSVAKVLKHRCAYLNGAFAA